MSCCPKISTSSSFSHLLLVSSDPCRKETMPQETHSKMRLCTTEGARALPLKVLTLVL